MNILPFNNQTIALLIVLALVWLFTWPAVITFIAGLIKHKVTQWHERLTVIIYGVMGVLLTFADIYCITVVNNGAVVWGKIALVMMEGVLVFLAALVSRLWTGMAALLLIMALAAVIFVVPPELAGTSMAVIVVAMISGVIGSVFVGKAKEEHF